MGSLRKIRKNAENYAVGEVAKSVTSAKDLFEVSNNIRKIMEAEYRDKLRRMADEYQRTIKADRIYYIDTVMTEFIFELAKQMGFWQDTEVEFRDDKVDRIQEIYINTIESIKKYGTDEQNSSDLHAKKSKIKKDLNITI